MIHEGRRESQRGNPPLAPIMFVICHMIDEIGLRFGHIGGESLFCDVVFVDDKPRGAPHASFSRPTIAIADPHAEKLKNLEVGFRQAMEEQDELVLKTGTVFRDDGVDFLAVGFDDRLRTVLNLGVEMRRNRPQGRPCRRWAKKTC